jgi:hypothetical protein
MNGNPQPNITISIERLILDGLPLTHAQHPLLQAAIETELARLLAADGLAHDLQSGGAFPRVPGGNIQLSGHDTPAHLGQQIARAVHSSIGGSKR